MRSSSSLSISSEIKIEIIHADAVQTVHQVFLNEGGADTNEFLVQTALAVDQAVAAFIGNHDVFALYAGGTQPAIENFFALGNTIALAVVTAGVNHGAAALDVKIHHLVCFGLSIQREPSSAKDQARYGLVQSSDIDIFHRNTPFPG